MSAPTSVPNAAAVGGTPSAENALRLLGGKATALDLRDKLTCVHCGFGLSVSIAQRLMQRAEDRGDIIVGSDLSLSIAPPPSSALDALGQGKQQ